jgi:hypothetical protein
MGLAILVLEVNSGKRVFTCSNAADRCTLPTADSSSSFNTLFTAWISSMTASRRASVDTLRTESEVCEWVAKLENIGTSDS